MKIIIKNFINTFKPLFLGILGCGLSLSILQPFFAKQNEKYNDLIIAWVAMMGANKTGEMKSLWISLFIGISTMFFYQIVINKNKIYKVEKEDRKLDILGVGLFFIPFVCLLVVKQEVNYYLLIIGMVYYFSYILTDRNKELSQKILLLLFSVYFSLLSLKAITDRIGSREILKMDTVKILTVMIFITLIFYLKRNKFHKILQVIIGLQMLFPFSLLIYLTNKYDLNGEIYKIPFNKRYKLLIIIVILGLVISNIKQYYEIKKGKKIILFISTIIVVFILNNIIFEPLFMHSGDFWHIGEEVVPWHQVFVKGMKPYQDYSPSSGMYGMVVGFVQNMIFGGASFSFNASQAIVYLFYSILMGILCYQILGEKKALVIAMFIPLPLYNRVIMLLFSILFLSLPKLIKNRIRWIQIYGLFSIFSIFYYPVNGVAVALSLFPFCIIQIYLVYKERIWKIEIRNKMFWVLNIILIITVIKFFNIFLGLVRHTLILSSQSILANGKKLYGYSVPRKWFMNFFSSKNLIREEFWYLYIFLVSLSAILLFFYLTYLYINKKEGNLIDRIQTQSFLLLSASGIAIPVNYLFTANGGTYSDAYFGGIEYTLIVFVGVFFLIFLFNEGERIFGYNIRVLLIGLTVGFIFVIQQEKSYFLILS